MKIKFLIFFLLLTFCSKSEITSESIEIQDFQIQELTYLESNKNAVLDSEFLFKIIKLLLAANFNFLLFHN